MMYIIIKTKILIYYNYIKTCLINVETIKGINNNIKYNLRINYFLSYFIYNLYIFSKYLTNKIENVGILIGGNYDKIYIKKNNYECITNNIYQLDNQKISLYNIIKTNYLINHLKKNNIRIFKTIKLQNMDYSLKDILMSYKDNEGNYSNTLNNILEFNNIKVSENENVEINYLDKRKNINVLIPYDSIKDEHINYFYNNDFSSY